MVIRCSFLLGGISPSNSPNILKTCRETAPEKVVLQAAHESFWRCTKAQALSPRCQKVSTVWSTGRQTRLHMQDIVYMPRMTCMSCFHAFVTRRLEHMQPDDARPFDLVQMFVTPVHSIVFLSLNLLCHEFKPDSNNQGRFQSTHPHNQIATTGL